MDQTFHVVGLTFHIVDVFAQRRYSGNQLAVFRGAHLLSDAEMQAIANEMHFSETTFITNEDEVDGGYDIRIFTPGKEVPFAGHPAIGTAFVIQQEIIRKPVEEILLNLKVGQVPVSIRYKGDVPDLLWMKPNPPKFGVTIDPGMISAGMNLRSGDIDPYFPIEEVSTGLPFLIVPIKTLEALKRIRISRAVLQELMRNMKAKCILAFTTDTYDKENDLTVRVFADALGIPEDPATGSGNGCLGAYLIKHKVFGEGAIEVRVEQGRDMNRPSLILLKAGYLDDEIHVEVGGNATLVASGELI